MWIRHRDTIKHNLRNLVLLVSKLQLQPATAINHVDILQLVVYNQSCLLIPHGKKMKIWCKYPPCFCIKHSYSMGPQLRIAGTVVDIIKTQVSIFGYSTPCTSNGIMEFRIGNDSHGNTGCYATCLWKGFLMWKNERLLTISESFYLV